MSRHLLIDCPDHRVVVGYDHMLRSFFGQVFDPGDDAGTAVDGWPTSSGLGLRRPCAEPADAAVDLRLLMTWGESKVREWLFFADRPDLTEALEHLSVLGGLLRREFQEGDDRESPAVPACLREPRP